MEQQYDDTFLARWLANELTAEELQEFENSEDFEKFSQIVETLESAEVTNFDVDANFNATLEKLTLDRIEENPKRRIIPRWSYLAAASVAIIFLVFTFLFNDSQTTYTTTLADKTNFELPDGSLVNLNADSELSFNSSTWNDDRSLTLSGEAYFKVEKGSKFTVNTDQGNVSVLGTQFTVQARPNLYQVECFEGKVLVVNQKNDSIYLTKGMAYIQRANLQKEYTLDSNEPSWINNESSFMNTPIELVMDELERQFAIQISGRENLVPAEFSGRFSHKDANLAIQTVFLAMEIKYTMDTNGNVVILKP